MVDFEDDFIVGAKKATKKNYDKNDQRSCILAFKKYFMDEFKIDTWLQSSFTGDIEKLNIRATLWRIILGAIPLNQNYSEWIETVTKQRNNFKNKLKTYNNLKKLAGDPLGGLSESSDHSEGWNSFFKDNELKKLINLDISRTYQDKDLFQNTAIKELLTNILFIWAKDNNDPSYRQGMNEILAVLLFSLYPFYFSYDKKTSLNSSNVNKLRTSEGFENELYSFLYDEDELQADLFILFDNIMKRGVTNLYLVKNDDNSKTGDKFTGKKKDLFQLQYQEGGEEEKQNLQSDVAPLQRRCNRIYIDYLKLIDQELHNHLVKIDVNPTLFLVRWLKCLLNREFHPRDVIVLWDTILANDVQERQFDEKSNRLAYDNLNMLDYLCVSMITYIREDILRREQVECLQRLFKYPPIESPVTLIKMALNIKSVILKKLIFKDDNNQVSSSNPKPSIQTNVLPSQEGKQKQEISQSNYNSNPSGVRGALHPLDKPTNDPLKNGSTGVSYPKFESKVESASRITNMGDCVKQLESISFKYKDQLQSKDYEDFQKIIDFLKKYR